MRRGTPAEKRDFTEYCFRARWRRPRPGSPACAGGRDLAFQDPAYRAMWAKLNAEAGLTGLPDLEEERDGGRGFPGTTIFFAFGRGLQPAARVQQGEEVVLETHDCFQGQLQTSGT